MCEFIVCVRERGGYHFKIARIFIALICVLCHSTKVFLKSEKQWGLENPAPLWGRSSQLNNVSMASLRAAYLAIECLVTKHFTLRPRCLTMFGLCPHRCAMTRRHTDTQACRALHRHRLAGHKRRISRVVCRALSVGTIKALTLRSAIQARMGMKTWKLTEASLSTVSKFCKCTDDRSLTVSEPRQPWHP